MIGVEFDERKVKAMTKEDYKHFIKKKIQIAAFEYLRKLQETHSKIRNIAYSKLEIQNYMKSPILSDEEVNCHSFVSLLKHVENKLYFHAKIGPFFHRNLCFFTKMK